MQHLSPEQLARLVDEAPDAEEALHLGGCHPCRAGLEALREQTAVLGSLADLAPPTAAWPRLAARLRAEGLVARPAAQRSRLARAAVRAAAAVVLFAAGALAGGRAGSGVPAPPATAGEAADRLRDAEADYLRALARYADLSGEARAADPLERLVALEGIVLTTSAALVDAPADPVINGYHLMAVGQREALLRQIDETAGDVWY